MLLKSPFQIGSRLLPGLRVGTAFLSLEYIGVICGREAYRWFVDIDGVGEFSEADLKSGVQGCTTQAMFGTFLAFLEAAAESYAYGLRSGSPGENADLFPATVVEWAYQHSDELGMLRLEIEESGEVLIEE